MKLKTIFWAGSMLVRYGWPKRFVTTYVGLGDELMVSAAFWELQKRGKARGVWLMTRYPEIWEGCGIKSSFIPWNNGVFKLVERLRIPAFSLGYADPASTPGVGNPLPGHAIFNFCRQLGIQGAVGLKPHLILSPSELGSGRIFAKQIVIQSSNLGGTAVIPLKRWPLSRFEQVTAALIADGWQVIQLGSPQEPSIEGTVDLRGQTSLREAASILANSQLFIGLVGGLMHLARAVDCPAVVIYGGREETRLAGYSANLNLSGLPPCAPCYFQEHCPEDLKCMTMIEADCVIEAARGRLKASGPLPVDLVEV